MMLKQLVDFRDFCYVWAVKQQGESYAEFRGKMKLKAMYGTYYLALLMLISVLNYKAGNPIPIPRILEENVFAQLIAGLFLLVPFNFFMNFLLKKISSLPIDKDMSPERYRMLRPKVIVFFILGMTLAIVFPFLLDGLLPPFYN
ncbi:hypothetical protein [Adhaeribacter rhizoryzae]|uniref:Uncharacterized protein n=1 Tax=Adhaeribacter rhizoryzae TaxID=2607907 RepID=A0A5M6DH93_9BACT|nr:hypothetical protein [Adhaeribacter rhizoryzae]KAA5545640.1 hypothetical protein F0145_11920 [Adhaeribacter rhizoryzae]